MQRGSEEDEDDTVRAGVRKNEKGQRGDDEFAGLGIAWERRNTRKTGDTDDLHERVVQVSWTILASAACLSGRTL